MVMVWSGEVKANRALASASAAFTGVFFGIRSDEGTEGIPTVDLVVDASFLVLLITYSFAALFVLWIAAASCRRQKQALPMLICCIAGGAMAAYAYEGYALPSIITYIAALTAALLIFRMFLNDEIRYW